jgi:hypothetical protein
MGMNKKFKNSVFVSLFSDEQLLRELYNALAGTNYGDDVAVSINTLENVLFMERQNDISFTIGGKLVILLEHQSTINRNMPLRFLFYIPRVYERLVDKRAIYREDIIRIPLPDFLVAYNGSKDQPDYEELRLSDAFIDKEGKSINLELVVKVININHGHNPEILNRCKTLKMYSEFVERVKKELRPNMSREELKKALQKAINYCIGKGILKEYLEKHSTEVRNMLYTKWNWKDYVAVKQEELREELEAKYQTQLRQVQEQDQTKYQAQLRQDQTKYQAQLRQVQEQDQERIRQLEEENRRLRGE